MALKIRKSMIQDFTRCPARTKAVWLDKLKFQLPDIAKIGTSFHRAVKEFYETVEWDDITTQVTLEDSAHYMRQCFPRQESPLIKPMVDNFIRFAMWQYLETRGKGKEYFFPLEQEFYVETRSFQGTMDGIFKVNEHQNRVHEWKTGDGFNVTSLRRELAFYCVIGNNTQYRGTLNYISCYNPNLHKYMCEKLSGNSVRATRNWLEKLNEAIRTGVWPRQIGPSCRGCPITSTCLQEVVNWEVA